VPEEARLLLPYLLVATAAGVAGGLVASWWSPGLMARSAVQHFAAGVVIAAVASGMIPEVSETGTVPGILIGFAAGGVTMIALKWLVVRFEKTGGRRRPVGLAAAAAVDTLIDGAVISAGFAMGEGLGGLLTIALGIELFFLTLSVGSELHKDRGRRWTGLLVTTGIALLLPAGAATTVVVLMGASEAAVAVFLAFGAAALIYLIAEELLVESIQAEESIFSTAMLFAGFLVLFALKLVSERGAPWS
jgi:zinc transporter, ZIP family